MSRSLKSFSVENPTVEQLGEQIGFLVSCLEALKVDTKDEKKWISIGKELDLKPNDVRTRYKALKNQICRGRLKGAIVYKEGVPGWYSSAKKEAKNSYDYSVPGSTSTVPNTTSAYTFSDDFVGPALQRPLTNTGDNKFMDANGTHWARVDVGAFLKRESSSDEDN